MAFLMAQGVSTNSHCGVNITSPSGHATELNSVMVNNNYLPGSTTAGVCLQSWPSPSVSMPTVCSQMYSPVVTSCSDSMHGCKRKHELDNDLDLNRTSKIRLTDENIARHMQHLSIHRFDLPTDMPVPTGAVSKDLPRPVGYDCQYAQASQTSQSWPDLDFPLQLDRDTQWQNFQTLEERLETIDEDVESNEKEQSSSGDQPRLHIVQDLGKMVYQEPVVPKEILKKIMNPCWEVILWSPPGDGVKKLINKDDEKDDDADDDSIKCVEEITTMEAEIVGNIDSFSQPIEPFLGMESELEMDDMEDL